MKSRDASQQVKEKILSQPSFMHFAFIFLEYITITLQFLLGNIRGK